jgi:bifunctional UDP-N-acetylglucosamine pyrophosphorylase/glucosamine-1-phosphate N-acetyltransferase
VELAQAEHLFQQKKRREFMTKGVTLKDPATTYFSADTDIEGDVVIGQNVVFGLGVRIERKAEILPFCMIEGTHIHTGAVVGPFARLRPDTVIGEHAKVGNFVEIKKSTLDAGAKVNHLSYIGDSVLGKNVNIGAGTITCNYDGFSKSKTVVKDGAFIGSNTLLVAPVTVGERAYTASGTVVTKDVPAHSLAIARPPFVIVEEWAIRFRNKKRGG